MKWEWEENSILCDYSPYTPCKDIFQAVCNELGKYYQQKGFKYSKSRPKITYKCQEFKLEICFWSSAHNMPGKYVLLNIVPTFYLIKIPEYKSNKGQKNNGYILGHPSIFIYSSCSDKAGTVRIKQIYDEDIVYNEDRILESTIKINNTCNVYGITTENFQKIIEFIDNQVLCYIDVLKDSNKLLKFIEESNRERSYYLQNENLNRYVEMTFPNDMDKIICTLENKFKYYEFKQK